MHNENTLIENNDKNYDKERLLKEIADNLDDLGEYLSMKHYKCVCGKTINQQ